MELWLGGWFVLVLLWVLFAGLGRESSAGMTRWIALLCGMGVTLALLMPHWSQTLLLLGVVWNVQRQHPPSNHQNYLEAVLAVAGVYLLLIQQSWAWFIPAFLWALTGVGTFMGLWAMTSVLYFKAQRYAYTWTLGPMQFTLEERGKYDDHGLPRSGAKDGDIWCGQFMTNFTQAVFCLTIAATVGLWVSGTAWFILLTLPIQFFTLGYYLKIHSGLGQWVPHMLVLAMTAVGLSRPWWAVNAFVVGCAVLLGYLWKYNRLGQAGGADSGRLVEWREMVHVWRNSHNWWTYLFGFGIRSWVQVAYDKALMKAKTTGQRIHNIFTMAHNEYIQHLFEGGFVGFTALVAYTGHVWWQTAHLHHGLFLVVTVMISIAMLSYPWAFYHRAVVPATGPTGKATFHEHRFGSPGLFWISLLLAVLAHG